MNRGLPRAYNVDRRDDPSNSCRSLMLVFSLNSSKKDRSDCYVVRHTRESASLAIPGALTW